MSTYFYARVSTRGQNLARQLDASKEFKGHIDATFCDKQSGKDFDRAEYQRMKNILKAGDEIVIKELDRLGRNKEGIKEELQWFKEHSVQVRILDLPSTLIDFQGEAWIGEMVNNIIIEVLGSIAEHERLTTRQRQAEGIAAKRATTSWGDYGRPRKDIPNIEELYLKCKRGEMTLQECLEVANVSRRTWYTKVKEAGLK